jgi:hypothetical protein
MLKLTLFFLGYRFAPIGAAIHAYMMRKDRFVTLRTKGDVGWL